MGNVSGNQQLMALINAYEKEGLAEFAKAYDSFRKEAIFDYGLYIECEKIMKSRARELDQIKQGICATFLYMRQSLEVNNLTQLQERQNLIDTIGKRISKAYETLNAVQEAKNISVRFLHMHIILDMCFACFRYKENYGYISRLHLPAMFYDLLARWNEEQREKAEKQDETGQNKHSKKTAENFVKFYGEEAKKDILNHTCQNVDIYCSRKNQDAILWLKKEKKSAQKRYVIDFADKLLSQMNDVAEKETEKELPKAGYETAGLKHNLEKPQEQIRKEDGESLEIKGQKPDGHKMIADERNNEKTESVEKKTAEFEERKRTLNKTIIITLAVLAFVCFLFIIILVLQINGKSQNQTRLGYNTGVSRSFIVESDET